MTIEEIKAHLSALEGVNFQLPNGQFVPEHFHVTEVGLVSKHFIDCGGVERMEKVANFQLWNANDTEHRLKPQKLINIINLAQTKLGIEDLEIEVEYQGETIGKYNLNYDSTAKVFQLVSKQTNCLAQDACGINQSKPKINLLDLVAQSNCCDKNGGCC